MANERSEIKFKWGKATNPFSPDCCHMAGLVWPGCDGLKLVPGAREVKIYSVPSALYFDENCRLEAHLAALLGFQFFFKVSQGALQGVVNGWWSQPFRHSVVFYLGYQRLVVIVYDVPQVHNRPLLPRS